MSGRNTNSIFKVITYIVLVLLLIAAIGFIIRFTNGGTTDFKAFYVQIGETVYTEDSQIELPYGSTHFETKYTFASNEADKHKGYKVQIVPNVTNETNFDFTVNGQIYSFGAEKDFTSAFEIEYGKTGFTINNYGLRVDKILQSIYDGQTVTVPEIKSEKVYFNLVVSSYNEKQTIILGLRFAEGMFIELPEKVIL